MTIMKTSKSILSVKIMLSAILTVGVAGGLAQTVDTSKGTVLDSATSRSAVALPNQPPAKLTATLAPLDQGGDARGSLVFTQVGAAVSVTGRVEGLIPNKRYALSMQPTTDRSKTTVVEPANPPSEAGTPAAAPPKAGAPAAGAPATGRPDGETRPGARGAGTEGTPVVGTRATKAAVPALVSPSPERELGIVLSDAMGASNVNTIVRNADLTQGPNSILGNTIFVKRAPPLDTPAERPPVASGVIVVPGVPGVPTVPVVPGNPSGQSGFETPGPNQ